MNALKPYALRIAFVIAVLSVGLSFWTPAYAALSVPNSLVGPGLAVIALAAMLMPRFAGTPPWKTVHTLALALPMAVMLRVLVEGLFDPGSHNLWPLEAVIATALGYVCAGFGGGIGWLLWRARPSAQDDDSTGTG
ncbi:MAG TPA: hypothetical protein VFN29_03880 [Chiayiivirga sp.]|nr:hypothetical protein [Chiayiivirga sp.]